MDKSQNVRDSDSWKEFTGLDKPGDVQDSNRQLERIHWTGQTWRYKTVTDSWKEFTRLDKPGDVTLTEDWIEFTGLDKTGDVTLTEDWTEFTGLDKTGDVQDSNRQLDGIRSSDVFHPNSHHYTRIS